MSRAAAITGPLGRFVGGACALLTNAGAGAAAGALAQGGGSPEAAAGILAAFTAYAGITSAASGARADATDDTLDEILLRLRTLTHEHRALREVFGHGDPALAAERLRGEPELLAFLEKEATAREAENEQFRMGLSVLIDEAVEQGRFREDAIAVLNTIAADTSEIKNVQAQHSAALAELLEHSRRERLSEEELRDRIRQEIEAEYAGELAQERNAREAAERAAQAVMDVRYAEGIEVALREHGGQAIVDALLALPTPTEEIKVSIHRKVAEWAYLIGDIQQAQGSISILLDINPDDIEALILTGQIHVLSGNFRDAEATFRRVLQLAGPALGLQAIAFGNLGNLFAKRSNRDRDQAEAEAMYRQALAIDKAMVNKEGMAVDYGNLGNVLRIRGDLDGAEAMYRKALAMNVELGRKEGMLYQYTGLGNILYTRGELEKAEGMYRKALEFNEHLGRKEGLAINSANLGSVLASRGDLDGAESMYKRALAIDKGLGREEGMAINYTSLGKITKLRNDTAVARRLWTLARDLYAKIGARPMVEQVQGWLDGLPPG